jgi:hypothetical protein
MEGSININVQITLKTFVEIFIWMKIDEDRFLSIMDER